MQPLASNSSSRLERAPAASASFLELSRELLAPSASTTALSTMSDSADDDAQGKRKNRWDSSDSDNEDEDHASRRKAKSSAAITAANASPPNDFLDVGDDGGMGKSRRREVGSPYSEPASKAAAPAAGNGSGSEDEGAASGADGGDDEVVGGGEGGGGGESEVANDGPKGGAAHNPLFYGCRSVDKFEKVRIRVMAHFFT